MLAEWHQILYDHLPTGAGPFSCMTGDCESWSHGTWKHHNHNHHTQASEQLGGQSKSKCSETMWICLEIQAAELPLQRSD